MVLLPCLATGQCHCSQKKPAWFDGGRCNYIKSYTDKITGTGNSYKEARDEAMQIIMENRSVATGQRVKIKMQNGHSIITGEDELTVLAHVLDEYPEKSKSDEYHVSFLVQTVRIEVEGELERLNITNEYSPKARVFVPGMAQLHKGCIGKGIFFIVGEAAFIGGIVAFEGLRTSYESKVNTTHNPNDRKNYIDNVNLMKDLRNGCIAGAAILYGWNVIDGIVAKGRKHVEPSCSYQGGKLSSNTDLKITPFFVPCYANGICLTLNF